MENIEGLVASFFSQEATKDYWFVRTQGGEYYEDFKLKNYIAIGYNDIKLKTLEALPENRKAARLQLRDIVKITHRCENKIAGGRASQIYRFHRDIKVGDIVMIPSVASWKLTIGIVESETYLSPYEGAAEGCPYVKRKRVRWLKTIFRTQVNPRLQVMLASRHITSKITNYAQYIDSTINDMYIKDDKAHLVLRVKTLNEVNTLQWLNVLQLAKLTEDFYAEHFESETNDPIQIKIQVESPGDARLSAKDKAKLWFFSIGLLFLVGGGAKFKFCGADIQIGFNQGFADVCLKAGQLYIDYIKAKTTLLERESMVKSVEQLDIAPPKELNGVVKFTEEDSQE